MNPKNYNILSIAAIASCMCVCCGVPSYAQGIKTSVPILNGRTIIPSRDVGLDQKLNGQVPLDLAFKDGRHAPATAVARGEYLVGIRETHAALGITVGGRDD